MPLNIALQVQVWEYVQVCGGGNDKRTSAGMRTNRGANNNSYFLDDVSNFFSSRMKCSDPVLSVYSIMSSIVFWCFSDAFP